MTLPDAIALAYRTNPSLLAQQQGLKALDESLVQARAGLGPQVSVTSQVTSQQASVEIPPSIFRPGETIVSHGRTDTQSASISQTLFDSGLSRATIGAAEADILAGREQLKRTESQLVQQVIVAYVAVVRDRELLRIAREAVQLLAAQVEDTEARFKVHEVTLSDRAQAQGRLEAAKAAEATAQARLEISNSQFLGAVGANPDTLEAPPELPGVPKSVEAAFDLAEANSPAIRASEYSEIASRRRVDQERAGDGVTIQGRIDYINGPENPYDARYYQHSLTARIVASKPLYTSGYRASRVRAAVDRDNQNRLTIAATRRQVIQDVAQAWSQMNAAQLVLKSAQSQVQLQLVAYNGLRQELKAGLRTTIEVLNAEQELQAARQSAAQAEFDLYQAKAAVISSIGLLRAEFLSSKLDRYAPEKVFNRVKDAGLAPWVGLIERINGVDHALPSLPPVLHDPAGEVRPLMPTPADDPTAGGGP